MSVVFLAAQRDLTLTDLGVALVLGSLLTLFACWAVWRGRRG